MMRTAELTITDVLTHRLVEPAFQPIVDLAGGGVVGVEALARGPAGSALEFPDQLFAAGREASRLGELDMLCCEQAIEGAAAAAAAPPLLFVNAEPGVLDQPLSPRLLDLLRSGLPFRMVLEFTERALPAVPGSLLRIAGQVQDWGNALALDDVGVDPMSLAFLPIVEPEVIKLDMSLVRNPGDAHTRAVATLVRSESRRTGAMVIAEGIETEDDLSAARELGAHWGQGWLFGRPGRLDQVVHDYRPQAAAALRPPRPGFHRPVGTPFAIAAAHPSTATADAPAALAATTDSALVMVAGDAGGLRGLTEQARSVITVEPIPGETTVVVMAEGRGVVTSTRGAHRVTSDHLPTAAACARILLSRSR
ncbi:EAL domain-containing protein [Actinoplanes sp. NPDC020271]|uniref:EAL domain-containing protein n=1 Tax=Actinoplanes sp. NPDC020271 TaxID=3363896 RepID=UPI0037B725DD